MIPSSTGLLELQRRTFVPPDMRVRTGDVRTFVLVRTPDVSETRGFPQTFPEHDVTVPCSDPLSIAALVQFVGDRQPNFGRFGLRAVRDIGDNESTDSVYSPKH